MKKFTKQVKVITEANIPPFPKHLAGKYTEEEWKQMHEIVARREARKEEVLKTYAVFKQLTNNFTDPNVRDKMSEKQFEGLSNFVTSRGFRMSARKPRYEKASPIYVFQKYLIALVDGDQQTEQRLFTWIKNSISNADKYFAAIKKRIDSEK